MRVSKSTNEAWYGHTVIPGNNSDRHCGIVEDGLHERVQICISEPVKVAIVSTGNGFLDRPVDETHLVYTCDVVPFLCPGHFGICPDLINYGKDINNIRLN